MVIHPVHSLCIVLPIGQRMTYKVVKTLSLGGTRLTILYIKWFIPIYMNGESQI